MSHPRPIKRLFLAICGACLLVTAARADDCGGTADQTIPLDINVTRGEVIGTEQVQRAYVSAGTNQIMFVVPGGARASMPTADRVTFIPPDYRYYLSFRIIVPPAIPQGSSSADYYRSEVLTAYPGATITSETSETALNQDGQGFQLRWTNRGGEEEIVRVAYIQCWAGVLEFCMVVDKKNSDEALSSFRSLLMDCRSNEHGKIEAVAFASAS